LLGLEFELSFRLAKQALYGLCLASSPVLFFLVLYQRASLKENVTKG
jgi:hypothetical protein